jgi:hypothetical protein
MRIGISLTSNYPDVKDLRFSATGVFAPRHPWPYWNGRAGAVIFQRQFASGGSSASASLRVRSRAILHPGYEFGLAD